MDSAFMRTEYTYITDKDLEAQGYNEEMLAMMKQATSCRQMAEWGMRAFQGSFPRINGKWRHEDRKERKIKLALMVLLFNYRTRTVGLNQIQTVYMPNLLLDAETLANNNL
jgi:hypothetical protein